MKEHKCEGLLNSQVKIKYDYKLAEIMCDRDELLRKVTEDILAWRMFAYDEFEGLGDYVYTSEVSYCQYCGIKLEEGGDKMDSSKLSIKVHFEEPVYTDKNTVEIYYTLGNTKQSKPIVAKFNGQVWQTVDNK